MKDTQYLFLETEIDKVVKLANKPHTVKNYEYEKINYSNYQANETVEIEKHISENKLYLNGLLSNAIGRRLITLLLAPTGSGKTYSTLELIYEISNNTDQKFLFILPNSTNVEQAIKEYRRFNVTGAYGDLSVTQALEVGNIILLTWDKFIQIDKDLLHEYVAIVDEIHQIYTDTSFRGDKINLLMYKLSYCMAQIHITATPNKLDFSKYGYILEYKQTIQTNYAVKLYDKICYETIKDVISNSKKFALFKDDTKFLECIQKDFPNRKIDVITSESKDLSEAYKHIMIDSHIGDFNGICNTSTLIAGVNIKDQDVTDVILVGNKDIATIKQYVARIRDLFNCNVHIFCEFEEDSNIFDVEWLINEVKQQVTAKVELANMQKDSFSSKYLNISPIPKTGDITYYYNKDKEAYMVSEEGIRHLCYKSYYEKASVNSFKYLLNEYFPNVEIVHIDDIVDSDGKIVDTNQDVTDYKKLSKEEKDEALEKLEAFKENLVGSVEVYKRKVSKETHNYLSFNNIDVLNYAKYLKDNGIYQLFSNSSVRSVVSRYTSYVVKSGFTYDMAWKIANKSNLARTKFFRQINNIIYREVEAKYPKLMKYGRVEDKLYAYIIDLFKVGKSYTGEQLETVCNTINIMIPLTKINSNKLGMLLNSIFVIDATQYRKGSTVPQHDYIFSYNNGLCHGTIDKKINVYTINRFITVDDIVDQNELDANSKKIIDLMIEDRINKIDVEAKELQIRAFQGDY